MTASNIAALPAQAVPRERFALTPTTLSEAMEFAGVMSKSSIVPKDYQGNPGNILVAVQWGAEIGLPPLQAMQSIAVINGRPSIWGDAVLALVRGSGLLERIREEPTDAGCTCTLKRRGEDEVVRTYTVEDAKKAGLWGKSGPWQQYPKRMLQMRARAFALRDVFPDVLRGVYIAEEAQDMQTERRMGPVDEVKPAALPNPTRAESVKAALAQRKAGASPALADVLNAISTADSEGALKRCSELAAALTDEAERSAARKAYRSRRDALSTVAQADPQTGEIAPPEFDWAAALHRLTLATDADAAAIIADELRAHATDDARQAQLDVAYREVVQALKA